MNLIWKFSFGFALGLPLVIGCVFSKDDKSDPPVEKPGPIPNYTEKVMGGSDTLIGNFSKVKKGFKWEYAFKYSESPVLDTGRMFFEVVDEDEGGKISVSLKTIGTRSVTLIGDTTINTDTLFECMAGSNGLGCISRAIMPFHSSNHVPIDSAARENINDTDYYVYRWKIGIVEERVYLSNIGLVALYQQGFGSGMPRRRDMTLIRFASPEFIFEPKKTFLCPFCDSVANLNEERRAVIR